MSDISVPWGRVMPAMVTPFRSDGAVDLVAVAALADHLVDTGHDGIVVAGTTGEAPTLSDDEHIELVREVVRTIGSRAKVVVGVGNNDTRHTVELAVRAASAGADGVLVVTPYYNKPPQAGVLAHFRTVADATELPVMLYDIPGRTGTKIAPDTLRRAAEHRNIVALKEASGALFAGAETIRDTDLVVYSGDDALNLPWLALGAVGIVSVVSHLAGRRFADLVTSAVKGDLEHARSVNAGLLALIDAVMNRTQGAIMVKAALALQGAIPNPRVRSPLVEATPEQTADVRQALLAADLLGVAR